MKRALSIATAALLVGGLALPAFAGSSTSHGKIQLAEAAKPKATKTVKHSAAHSKSHKSSKHSASSKSGKKAEKGK